MAILAWGLLVLAGVLLGAALVLISTPVHIRLAAIAGDQPHLTLEVLPLWGLGPRLRIADTTRPRSTRRRPPAKSRSRRWGRKRRGRSFWSRDSAFSRGLIRDILDMFRGEMRRIHFDSLNVDIRFGTGDPAETGQIFGLATPFIYGFPSDAVSVSLQPDFVQECFRGRIEAALHFIPVALLGPIVRLGLAFLTRRK